MKKFRLFAGNSHPAFAKRLAELLEVELRKIDIHWFGNQNVQIDLGGGPNNSVRGCCCFVLQTQAPPVSDNIIELLWIVNTLKTYGAKDIIAIIPYLPYIRSDKSERHEDIQKDRRLSLGAKYMIRHLQFSGVTGVVIMDPHFTQVESIFDIPYTEVRARNIFIDYIKENFKPKQSQYIVVAPDFGEAKHIGPFSTRLVLPASVINKHRIGDEEAVNQDDMQLIGRVKGRICLLVDDEALSLGTLRSAAKFLVKENGAIGVVAFLTHPVLMSNKFDVYQSLKDDPYLQKIFVTNTIPIPPEKMIDKITVLPVEHLFAKKIQEIYNALVK